MYVCTILLHLKDQNYVTILIFRTKPVNYTEVRTVTEPTMVYNVTVTNTGKIPGAVSVLAFIKYDVS